MSTSRLLGGSALLGGWLVALFSGRLPVLLAHGVLLAALLVLLWRRRAAAVVPVGEQPGPSS